MHTVNVADTLREYNLRKGYTVVKQSVTDRCQGSIAVFADTVNIDCCQVRTVFEAVISKLCYLIRYFDRTKIRTARKSIITDFF